jgi:hypothetical protein
VEQQLARQTVKHFICAFKIKPFVADIFRIVQMGKDILCPSGSVCMTKCVAS